MNATSGRPDRSGHAKGPSKGAAPVACAWGSRRGSASIIELFVVMALMSVIMMSMVRILFSVSRAERGHARRMATSNTTVRLARILRQDIHRAAEARLPPVQAGAPAVLELVLKDPEASVIVYTVERGSLERKWTTAGGSQEVKSRETFLTPGYVPQFEISEDPALVACILTGQAPTAPSPAPVNARLPDLRIEGALARDQKVSTSPVDATDN